MKQYFIVSLIKNGILGGGMVADAAALTYYTGKTTVPSEYRCLSMEYAAMRCATVGRNYLLPTVTVRMRSSKEYCFAVFFGRKRLVRLLHERGVEITSQ